MPLILLDRALDLALHFRELLVGLQPPAFDPGDRIVADHVVGVGPECGHDAMPSSSEIGRRGTAATRSVTAANALAK